MGVIDELRGIYEYNKDERKEDLNAIIAEEINVYLEHVCDDYDKQIISEEYGNIMSVSRVLAEDFTSNGGNFSNKLLLEEYVDEAAGKAIATAFTKLLGKGGILRKVGKGIWTLLKGTGKIIKRAGLFCLKHPALTKLAVTSIIIYEGWMWIKGEDGLFRRIYKWITGSGKEGKKEDSSVSVNTLGSDVYSKAYGSQYADANPEDYRIA